jgi:putative Holliday junction resolvase
VARILGLDVGERRVGVAISDPDERLAVPLRIVERRDSGADVQAIVDIARAEQVEALVVGNPLSLSGKAGPQARRVQAFARRVAEAAGLPLALCDERLTSVQAERATAVRARSAASRHVRRPTRAPSDDVAAAIILQSYLDRRRSEVELPAQR